MTPASHPSIHTEEIDGRILQELLSRPQWIAWWSVVGEGLRVQLPNGRLSGELKAQAKPHKLPINPYTCGLAASTRQKTWSSFQAACAAVQRWSLTRIGFVFAESDPFEEAQETSLARALTFAVARAVGIEAESPK